MGERDFSDIWLLFTDCFVFHLYRGLGEDGQGRRGEGRGTFYVLNSGATSLISPRLSLVYFGFVHLFGSAILSSAWVNLTCYD